MDVVTKKLLAHFAEVFNAQMKQGSDILAGDRYEGKTAVLV
jgi:hypothetical protein